MGCKRVLVIDDNEDLAEGLRELMELVGHDVDTAFTGLAGVAEAAGKSYDFIFIDVGLPDIDGTESARRIRAAGSAAQILFMTGYSAAEISTHIEEDGTELLVKPLNPELILKRIA